jgi:hypothetical protein
MFRRLFGRKQDDPTAAKQEGDVHSLGHTDDPRGGVQSDQYRHAEPIELVDDQGAAMMGPGGSPQDGSSPDERREVDRD